jgi:hypothetical protein
MQEIEKLVKEFLELWVNRESPEDRRWAGVIDKIMPLVDYANAPLDPSGEEAKSKMTHYLMTAGNQAVRDRDQLGHDTKSVIDRVYSSDIHNQVIGKASIEGGGFVFQPKLMPTSSQQVAPIFHAVPPASRAVPLTPRSEVVKPIKPSTHSQQSKLTKPSRETRLDYISGLRNNLIQQGVLGPETVQQKSRRELHERLKARADQQAREQLRRERVLQRMAEQPYKRAQAAQERYGTLRAEQQALIEKYTAAGYSRFEIQNMVKGMTMRQAEDYLSHRFDINRWEQYVEHVTKGAGASIDPAQRHEGAVSLARWQHMPEHLKLRMATGIHVSRVTDAEGNINVPQGYFLPKSDSKHIYPTAVITGGSHLGTAAGKLVTTFKLDKLLKRTALLGKHETVELRGGGVGGQQRASWRSGPMSQEAELIQVLNSAAVIGGSPGPAGQIYFSNKIKEAAQRITQDIWDERGIGFENLPRIGDEFTPGSGLTLGAGREPINVGDKWGHRVLDIHDIYDNERKLAGKRFVLEQFAPANEALVRGKAFWQKGVGTTADLSNVRGAQNLHMLSELKDLGGYAYAYWAARPQQELAKAMGIGLDKIKNLSYSELFDVGAKYNPLQAFERIALDEKNGILKTLQRPEVVSGHNLRDLQGKYVGTPEALGNDRYRVMMEYQALVAPVAMQASTDFPVRSPFLGYDELQALKLRDQRLYNRVMQGGAATQTAYKNIINAALATSGEFELPGGTIPIDQATVNLPYTDAGGAQQTLTYRGAQDIIGAAIRSAKQEMPDAGENIPRNVLQRHFADLWAKQENFTTVPTQRGNIVLAPGSSLERFRAGGEYSGEEVSQIYGRTFDLLQAYGLGDQKALSEAALNYQRQQLTIAGGENTVRRAMGAFVNNRDMLGTVVRGDRALHPDEIYVPGMEGQEISIFRFPTQGGNEYSMSFRGMSKKEAEALGLDTKSMYTSIQLQQALAGDYDGDLAYALRVGAIQVDRKGQLVTESGRKLSGVQDVLNAARAALNQGAGNLVEEYAGGISKEEARKKIVETIQNAPQLTGEQLQKQLIRDKGLYDKIGQYYNTFVRGMASLPGGNARQRLTMRGALQKVFNISHGFAQRPQALPEGAQHIQDLMTYNMMTGGFFKRAAEAPGSNALRGIRGLREEALGALLGMHVGDDPNQFALSNRDVARLNLPMGASRGTLNQMTQAVGAWRSGLPGSREREAAFLDIMRIGGSDATWTGSAIGSMLSSRSVYRTATKQAEALGIASGDIAANLGQLELASLGDFQGAEGQALLQSLFERGQAQEQAVLARHKPKGIHDLAEKARNLAARAMAWGNEFLSPKASGTSFDYGPNLQYGQPIGPEYIPPMYDKAIGPNKGRKPRQPKPKPQVTQVSPVAQAAAATPPPPPPPPLFPSGVGGGSGDPPPPSQPPWFVYDEEPPPAYAGRGSGPGAPQGGGPGGGGPGDPQRPIELSPPKISTAQLRDLRTLDRGLPGLQLPATPLHPNAMPEGLRELGEAAYRQELNLDDIRRKAFRIAAQGNPMNAGRRQIMAAQEVIRLTDPGSNIAQNSLQLLDLRNWMMESKAQKELLEDPVKAAKAGFKAERIDLKLGDIQARQQALRLGRLGGTLDLDAGIADSASRIGAMAQERRAKYEAIVPKIQEYNQALDSGQIGRAQKLHDELSPLVDELKDLKENIGLLKPEVKDHVDALKKQTSVIKEQIAERKQEYTALGQKLSDQQGKLAELKQGPERLTQADKVGQTKAQMSAIEKEIEERTRTLGGKQAQIEALEEMLGESAGGTPRALGKRPVTRWQRAMGELGKGYDPQRLFYQSQMLAQGYYMLGQPLAKARQEYLSTQYSMGQAEYAFGTGSMPQSVIQSQISQANMSRAWAGLGKGVEESWVMQGAFGVPGLYGISDYLAKNQKAAGAVGSLATDAVTLGSLFFGGKMLGGPLMKAGKTLLGFGARAAAPAAGSTAAQLSLLSGGATKAATASGGGGWLASLLGGGVAATLGVPALLGTGAAVLGNELMAGKQVDIGETAGELIQSMLRGRGPWDQLGWSKMGDISETINRYSPWGWAGSYVGNKIADWREQTGTQNQLGFESLAKYWDVATAPKGEKEERLEVDAYIKELSADVAKQLGTKDVPFTDAELAQFVKAFLETSGVSGQELEAKGVKHQDLAQMVADSVRSGVGVEEFLKVYQAAPGAGGYAPGTASGYRLQQWVNQGSLFERQQRLEAVQIGSNVVGFMGMSSDEQEAYNNQIYQMRKRDVSDFRIQQFQSQRQMGNQYYWSAAAYRSGNPQMAMMDEEEPWRPRYEREMQLIEDRRRHEDVKRELGTQTAIIDQMGQTVGTTWSGGRQQQEIEWQSQRLDMEERFWTKKREWEEEDFQMQQKMFDFQIRQMEYNLDREEKYAQLSERNYLRNYEIQKKIFDLQTKWQREDFAKQEQRMEVQRGWQIEDFGANRQQFELQAGWALEDMQRNLRYATGRERLDIRRQMERAEIMNNLKRDDMSRQESRAQTQYEWGKEDLATARARFEELRPLQEEQMRLSYEYFQQQKQLAEEDRAMRRQFAQEQIDLLNEQNDINVRQREEKRAMDEEDFQFQQGIAQQKLEWQQQDLAVARERAAEDEIILGWQRELAAAGQQYSMYMQTGYDFAVKTIPELKAMKEAAAELADEMARAFSNQSYDVPDTPTPFTNRGQRAQRPMVAMADGGATFGPTHAFLSEYGQEEHVVPSGGSLVLREPGLIEEVRQTNTLLAALIQAVIESRASGQEVNLVGAVEAILGSSFNNVYRR